VTERDLYHVFPETTRHADASIDGLYVIRTSVPAEQLASDAAVQAYKGLARVERAIRSLKTVDLKVRPIHHRLADRVRAHVFLCMLAYHVEWHMRQVLAPILFDDDDPAGAAARRARWRRRRSARNQPNARRPRGGRVRSRSQSPRPRRLRAICPCTVSSPCWKT